MNGNTIRVLVVEDEAPHADLIRRAFEYRAVLLLEEEEASLGQHPRASDLRVERSSVTFARSLREAHASLQAAVPDLVIADLRLPDGQGTELLPTDRERALYPVVIMTGQGDERIAVDAMKAGALDYVVKSGATLADMPRITERALREWALITERKRAEAEIVKHRLHLEELVAERTAELVKSQHALQEAHAFAESIVDTVREPLVVLDAGLKVISASRSYYQMLGVAREETEGQFLYRLGNKQWDIPRLRARLGKVVTKHTTIEAFEVGLDIAAIGPRVMLLSARQLYGKSHKPPMILLSIEDITERRRAEKEAQQHQAQLAHAARLSTMGEMATGIAHEINQPLAAMVTSAQACLRMMTSGKTDPADLRDVMERVAAEGLRAGEVIRRLKQFTRRATTERTAADLNQLVREAIGFVEAEVREKAITIRLDLAGRLPGVQVDPIQIEQVVLNLLRNGMEAIGSTYVGRGILTVQTDPNGIDAVEVSVSDTGPGLSEESIGQIFDPFFTTKPNGTGMGLSVSRSIIEAHGGHLWAERPGGYGATFHFRLPSVRGPIGGQQQTDGLCGR